MIQKFDSTMRDCQKYTENIMADIVDLFEKESISFTSNASTSEIVVNDKDKKEISDLIRTLPIPKSVLYFVLDICQVKKNVYIRKKIK